MNTPSLAACANVNRATEVNDIPFNSLAKLVYFYLLGRELRGESTTVSNSELAFDLGVTGKTISLTMQGMEMAGIIAADRLPGGAKTYQVIMQPERFPAK